MAQATSIFSATTPPVWLDASRSDSTLFRSSATRQSRSLGGESCVRFSVGDRSGSSGDHGGVASARRAWDVVFAGSPERAYVRARPMNVCWCLTPTTLMPHWVELIFWGKNPKHWRWIPADNLCTPHSCAQATAPRCSRRGRAQRQHTSECVRPCNPVWGTKPSTQCGQWVHASRPAGQPTLSEWS